MDIDVSSSGPMFDGRALAAAHECNEAIEEAVAQEGLSDIRMRLHRVLRHPTGYYQSHLTVSRRRGDRVVHDQDIIYGPWLERGHRSTRFRGYGTFRIVGQKLQAKAGRIAEGVIRNYLHRMQ